ncbi:MAG: AAA family ATPase, partial [Clostridia bacterium]|nr:AAA family ATPase [Clostridia bacterium]
MQPNAPLAVRLRPTAVDEIVGQRHLLAKGKVLSRIIESGNIPNMIFFGPPGTGKTTAANIAAAAAGKRLHKLNATTASIADIKAIIDELDTFLAQNGVVIYLDEI